jgi:cytochrome P450
MSHFRQTMSFALGLQRERAGDRFRGYVRREPMARLSLGPGRRDPYAIYDQLRARGALVPTKPGVYASTSHRVCSAVLRDRRFLVRLDDVPTDQLQMSFLSRNPPDHTRLRRLAQPAFSPRAVAGYTPRIEATIAEMLDRAASAGEFDLVSSFNAAVPIAVITDLLGVPDADSEHFAEIGRVIGSALGGVRSLAHARQLLQARAELGTLFARLFELRRAEPRDDVISRLVAAEGEDQIHPQEMRPMCILLLVAGFETTVNLIGNSVLALLSHPDQWRDLCADPAGLAPKVVEEVLRWDPPVQLTSRRAGERLELEGTVLNRGDEVITLIGGANRDPEVFDRPAVFDIHRADPADHLAFSSGIHYCLGKPLALLEATLAIQALAERMPGLALTGPVLRRNSLVIRGPYRIPATAGGRREAPVAVPAAAG